MSAAARILSGVVIVFLGTLVVAPPAVAAGRERPPAEVRAEVPITATDRGVGPANNSPTLVADPGDPTFVAMASRLDAPDYSCALHVSGDSGRSWAPLAPIVKLPPGAEKCYAPEVAFDGSGRLYYLFVGLAGGGNEPMGVFLSTSKDRGRTFTTPHKILGPLNFGVRMAIDPTLGKDGRVHLVWIKATSDPPLGGFGQPPNPIVAAYSDNRGRTFSKPVQVSDADRPQVVAPALELGADHTVHVAYYDLGRDRVDYQGLEGPVWEDPWALVVASSRDGGRRFGKGVVAEGTVVPPERVILIFTMTPPSLVAHGNRLCLAWTDGRHGDPDAFMRCSGDRGRHWASAHRLNDDPVANGKWQFMPRLSVAPNGRIDAIFYDRRDDPRNGANWVYYTYSTDDGHTFAPNAKVTENGSSIEIGQRYVHAAANGKVEFGSRLGLVSRSDDALAAWADTRNSRPMTTAQDVFSAVLTLPGQEDNGPTPLVVPAVLILSGALVAVLVRRRRRHRADAVSAIDPTPGGEA